DEELVVPAVAIDRRLGPGTGPGDVDGVVPETKFEMERLNLLVRNPRGSHPQAGQRSWRQHRAAGTRIAQVVDVERIGPGAAIKGDAAKAVQIAAGSGR